MSTFGFETAGNEVVAKFKDRVKGKTIVITGTSESGLGAETAISLAAGGPAQLVLLARTEAKVSPVIKKIAEIDSSIKASFVAIDLANVASVRQAASVVRAQIDHLDILINNAGIMAHPYKKTVDGIESQFASNHVGHFLLTVLLIDKIEAAAKKSSDGARIVNLTSDGYQISPARFDDWNFKDGAEYDPWSGYGQSKTANILFTVELASRLKSKGIQSFAVHPGVIFDTALADYMDQNDPNASFEKVLEIAVRNTGHAFEIGPRKTKQQGVSTTLRAALDPSIAGSSGSYMADGNVEPAREYATSKANAEKLWQVSEQLVGQKFDF